MPQRRKPQRRTLSGAERRQTLRERVRRLWGSRWHNIPVSNLRKDQLHEAIKEAAHLKAENKAYDEMLATNPDWRDDPKTGVAYLPPEITYGPIAFEDRAVLVALIAESRQKAWQRVFP